MEFVIGAYGAQIVGASPYKVSEEDVRKILASVEQVEGREEKLAHVFDWFVQNYTYLGYGGVRTYGVLRQVLQNQYKIVRLADTQTSPFAMELCNGKPSPEAFYLSNLVKFWATASEEDYARLERAVDCPANSRALTFLRERAKDMAGDFILDEAEEWHRFKFMQEHPTSYCGVCGDFASEFARICNMANLGVLPVEGLIFNGHKDVGHSYNVTLVGDELRFFDISAAIHIKEEKLGLKIGHFKAEEQDYFLKSFDELKAADGNDRRTCHLADDVIYQRLGGMERGV